MNAGQVNQDSRFSGPISGPIPPSPKQESPEHWKKTIYPIVEMASQDDEAEYAPSYPYALCTSDRNGLVLSTLFSDLLRPRL